MWVLFVIFKTGAKHLIFERQSYDILAVNAKKLTAEKNKCFYAALYCFCIPKLRKGCKLGKFFWKWSAIDIVWVRRYWFSYLIEHVSDCDIKH